MANVDLVAACDPAPEARAKVADKIGIPSVSETFDELLAE